MPNLYLIPAWLVETLCILVISTSFQLMNPNCKPIHARAYTVPRSVKQKLQQSTEIVRLVDIGVLEEEYSS
jgi:hypothetical protein